MLYTDFPCDWARYDMTEVPHQPQGMTPEALAQAMRSANRRMYGWLTLIRKAMRTLYETRNPMAAMFAWQSNVNYRNVATAG